MVQSVSAVCNVQQNKETINLRALLFQQNIDYGMKKKIKDLFTELVSASCSIFSLFVYIAIQVIF